MKSYTRKSNFELLRIIAMCIIIMIHFWAAADLTAFGLQGKVGNILGGVVVGIGNIGPGCFCLISGYFGIKFSKQKLIKMELMMISYSLLETLLLYVFFPQEMCGAVLFEQLIKSIIPFTSRKYWFYSCYICLFILSGYIQKFIDSLKEKELLTFLVISLTIFSILPTIFYFEIMQDAGKGLVQMILLYMIGRYIHMYKDISLSKWKCFLTLILLWCINTISIMHPIKFGEVTHSLCRDNSITNIAIMILLFYLFKDINFSSKFINRFTSNIFAVFALENACTHILSKILADFGLHVSSSATAFLLVILMVSGIFLVISIIGFIREFLFSRVDQLITNWILKLTNKLQKFIPYL